MKLFGQLLSGFVEAMIPIDLQSSYKEEMDVRQLTDKGFFTGSSYLSAQYAGVFWFMLP